MTLEIARSLLVSCESEKPTPTAALAARSAAATRLTQADRGERVALVAGAGEAMVAVKLVGPDIDNLTIDNLTLTTTILEVKQKALAAMPAGGPTSLPQLRILYQGRFMDDQKTLKGARPRRGRLPQPTAPQRELPRLARIPPARNAPPPTTAATITPRPAAALPPPTDRRRPVALLLRAADAGKDVGDSLVMHLIVRPADAKPIDSSSPGGDDKTPKCSCVIS